MREIASNVYGCGRWTTQRMKIKLWTHFLFRKHKSKKHNHVRVRALLKAKRNSPHLINKIIIMARFTKWIRVWMNSEYIWAVRVQSLVHSLFTVFGTTCFFRWRRVFIWHQPCAVHNTPIDGAFFFLHLFFFSICIQHAYSIVSPILFIVVISEYLKDGWVGLKKQKPG